MWHVTCFRRPPTLSQRQPPSFAEVVIALVGLEMHCWAAGKVTAGLHHTSHVSQRYVCNSVGNVNVLTQLTYTDK